jgi:hypothetical protein
MADMPMIDTAATVTTCLMINLTINQHNIQRVDFPMMLVLIHSFFCCFKISDGGNKKMGCAKAQQEIHHCMITDIILSNHGLQT